MKSAFTCFILFVTWFMTSCNNNEKSVESNECDSTDISKTYVERVDTNELIVLTPSFSRIDLCCGTEPSIFDNSVILFAEAAFTGQYLEEFDHFNIAGDHVSNGKRYKGYRCKRNTGAFIYQKGSWKFAYKNYSNDLDNAAKNGGAAFAQEMIIYNRNLVPTTRKDTNMNQFRALCERKNNLCIIESAKQVSFGDFKKKLIDYDVSNAIYLDMGGGWNYAWYRDGNKIIELHPKLHDYCTNWITFYK